MLSVTAAAPTIEALFDPIERDPLVHEDPTRRDEALKNEERIKAGVNTGEHISCHCFIT